MAKLNFLQSISTRAQLPQVAEEYDAVFVTDEGCALYICTKGVWVKFAEGKDGTGKLQVEKDQCEITEEQESDFDLEAALQKLN